jgi:hypothetical protein
MRASYGYESSQRNIVLIIDRRKDKSGPWIRPRNTTFRLTEKARSALPGIQVAASVFPPWEGPQVFARGIAAGRVAALDRRVRRGRPF